MNQRNQNARQLKALAIRLALFAAFHALFLVTLHAQQDRVSLRGEIVDQQGAVIVGAEVRLIDRSGGERKTASDRQGAFRFEVQEGDSYTLKVFHSGFGLHEEIVSASRNAKPAQISIVLYPAVRADVEVESDKGIVLDAERAAGMQVLKEKEVDSLPDDPDQLAQQLQNLAASGGGIPGGAVVTVDGFSTGGKLPPKSSIRQIRINPNLYSAEYETPPFQGGRVEIITKPGSGTPTGSAFFNYNGTGLNARDPFATTRAKTNTNRYGFSFGMPIIRNRVGFFLDFERRDIEDSATVNAIVLNDNLEASSFVTNIPNPKRLTIGSARADWQINQNNTVVFRYDFNQNKLFGQGIGGVNLPERGFDSKQTENSLRLTETSVVNPRTVNELRVGLTFNRIGQAAASNQRSIIVAGSFSSGGANLQNLSRDERRLEVADHLTTDIGRHSLKFGVQIFNRNVREVRAENTNGSFFFGGGSDGTSTISSLEQYRRALLGLPGGTPTQFSITSGEPQVSVNQWLFAAFVQDEWKLSPKLSLSLGFRYEAQTAPNDPWSFVPRLGVAFAPDKKQNWIFRSRIGVFYQRFDESLVLEAERLDGQRQQQIVIDSPSFPNPYSNGGANSAIPTTRILDSTLRPPASLQIRLLEAERQLPRGWKVSSSYSLTLNWNRLRSRNINAPLISALNPDPQTAPRPFGTDQNILQFESSGRAEGRVLYVGVNQNTDKYFSINAGYLNFDFRTDADTSFSLPQSSYDFTGEWARPFWQTRHRVFITTTVNLPYQLRLWSSFNAASGPAYSVTTGRDNNGDGNFNDRPSVSVFSDPQAVSTSFGFLNPNAINGNFVRNAGTNPPTATLDLNLSRVFLVGNKNESGESRYRLAANIRVANALNRANLIGTNGVLSSPFFGRATTANPARRIEFGLRFNF